MDRFLRFSARGAHLAWRVKNGAKSVPLRVIRTLPDGSELVMLHESDGMRTRRRRETGDPRAGRLPDTTARAGHLHHPHRDPQRPAENHPGQGPDHPPGPRAVPRPRDRHPLFREMADRNRVPSPEENRPGRAPPAARPVPGPRPPGSMGTPAHPQHHGHRGRPRRCHRRHRPRPDPLHRRPRPRPRPHRSRHPLQTLRTPPCQRKRPARQPERRDPRPPQPRLFTPRSRVLRSCG